MLLFIENNFNMKVLSLILIAMLLVSVSGEFEIIQYYIIYESDFIIY